MNYRDNQFQHMRFQRTDPTGRWSPMQEEKEEPLWLIIVGVVIEGAAP